MSYVVRLDKDGWLGVRWEVNEHFTFTPPCKAIHTHSPDKCTKEHGEDWVDCGWAPSRKWANAAADRAIMRHKRAKIDTPLETRVVP